MSAVLGTLLVAAAVAAILVSLLYFARKGTSRETARRWPAYWRMPTYVWVLWLIAGAFVIGWSVGSGSVR